jgi:hypothetical protein
MAEKQTTYKKIRQIQVRIRTHGGGSPGELPGEDDQFLVFLEGENEYYFVPLKTATNRDLEIEMIGVLREAFMHGKNAKLGYRESNGNRYISAVWIQN